MTGITVACLTGALEDAVADRLAAVHAACFERIGRVWPAATLQDLMTGPGTAVLLVPPARAFAMIRHVAGETEILTLATDPAEQRRGLARRLIDSLPAGPVFLEVATDNEAALALYAATGFVETGRRSGYYRRPDGSRADALVLSRTD